ncbi:MAG: hypothetical protein ABDH21_00315 [bacterium]
MQLSSPDDAINRQEYMEMKIYDFFSAFNKMAEKVNAQVILTHFVMTISKSVRQIRCTYYNVEKKILGRTMIGYMEVYFGGMHIRVFLSEDYEWLINIENRMLKKFTNQEIEYIFYKTFGYV